MSDEKLPGEEGWKRKEFPGIPASLGALWSRRDDDGNWCYAVRLDESHANAQGVVHGGVFMTFIDHAMSLLLWELSGRGMCVTVHLDCHFLNAVKPPAFLELDMSVSKEGKNLIYARAVVRDKDKPVVEANGVWSVRRS